MTCLFLPTVGSDGLAYGSVSRPHACFGSDDNVRKKPKPYPSTKGASCIFPKKSEKHLPPVCFNNIYGTAERRFYRQIGRIEQVRVFCGLEGRGGTLRVSFVPGHHISQHFRFAQGGARRLELQKAPFCADFRARSHVELYICIRTDNRPDVTSIKNGARMTLCKLSLYYF